MPFSPSHRRIPALFPILFGLLLCTPLWTVTTYAENGQRPRSWTCARTLDETHVTLLPLAPELAYTGGAITGMVRVGKRLLLLPRDPYIALDGETPFPGGRLIALDVERIVEMAREIVSGNEPGGAALGLEPIPLAGPDARGRIPGFSRFEAVAVGNDNRLLFLARAGSGTGERFCLLGGAWEEMGETARVLLDSAPPVCVDGPDAPEGYGWSALLLSLDLPLLLPESSGGNCSLDPSALRFTPAFAPAQSLPFPCLEYRVSDVSTPEDGGWFWALNRMDTGERERLSPAIDTLRAPHGTGVTHAVSQHVARLVRMRADNDGVHLADTAPVELELSFLPRAWEGVELIEEAGIQGVVLATDSPSSTMLGFAPLVCAP